MENRQQPITESFARIKVIGVGGGGCNAVNRMIDSGIPGIEYIAINTDAQSLMASKAKTRVSIGDKLTRGLGTGGDPEIGCKAAEESADELYEVLKGSDMVFIAAGMGGGTGTGASPIIAQAAKEIKALTIGVVTRPFGFEGSKRMQTAEVGIAKLKEQVDTLIVIPNDRILQVAKKDTSFTDAFGIGDESLKQGIQCISELITSSGLVNRDFADVRTIMSMGGAAFFAVGEASGEDRARIAAEEVINNHLLETTIEGARGILLNITGGPGMTMYEVNQAAGIIRENAHPDVNLLFGAAINPNMADKIHITVIATGFEQSNMRSRMSRIARQAESQARGSGKASGYDESVERKSPITDFTPTYYDTSDVEIPAFLRNRPANKQE